MQTLALRLLVTIGFGALVMTASGCSQGAPPRKAVHTVDQYLAKPDLMEAKLRECANNPGELRDTPDCINVEAASLKATMQKHGGSMMMGSFDAQPSNDMGAPKEVAEPKQQAH